MASVAGAIVVCYSWWGVNLLGAGLHSYGFTSGVRHALNMAYFGLFVIVLIGGCIGIYEWAVKRVAPEAASSEARRSAAAVASSWLIIALVGIALLGFVVTLMTS
mgnify:CR=1 FL=1